MFDIVSIATWEDVDIWRKDVESKLGLSNSNRIPILVVANKTDLITEQRPPVVTDEDMEIYVKKHLLYKLYVGEELLLIAATVFL